MEYTGFLFIILHAMCQCNLLLYNATLINVKHLCDLDSTDKIL